MESVEILLFKELLGSQDVSLNVCCGWSEYGFSSLVSPLSVFHNISYLNRLRSCGEGELVGGVHTLVWRSVQVFHELQGLEEEDKGREEVQEIERESQGDEKRSHGHDYGDGVKGLKHLEPRCVCG